MKPLSSLFAGLFAAAFLMMGSVAEADSGSDIFTYQGKLTNAQGAGLPDGTYRVGVRIWDVGSGGTTPLWARKYDVPVVGGSFSLMIGSAGVPWEDPAPLTSSLKLAVSGTSRFLEITVMSDADGLEKQSGQWQVLTPRQTLSAVPYAMNGCPPGTVVPFAGTVIPDGWVLCNGDDYPATDARYAALALALDGKYGNNGPGTFRVPDLKGRTVIGTGQGDTWSGAGGATNWAIGTKFGAEKHQMTIGEMPIHNHEIDDPGHAHLHRGFRNTGDGGGRTPSQSRIRYDQDPLDYGGESAQTGITIKNAGGDQPHNNMQPSLVLNYIIKL